MKDKYTFKPYDPIYKQLFFQEKARLEERQMPLQIEHVGSTAVEGLGGKGIIDIAVLADKEDFPRIKGELIQLGYTFRPAFSTPDRLYFVAFLSDPSSGERRCHLHLTHSSSEWRQFIKLRDVLRNSPELCQEYAEIKKDAALRAKGEGKVYRELKASFIIKHSQ